MSSEADTRPAVGLDDLIALNNEIVALVKAGVPLERGLAGLGHDPPSRLGRISTELAAALARGESLDTALASSSLRFPPLYRALAQVGVRSGRLGPVLESLARSARVLRDLRRMVLLASWYPMVVASLAVSMLAFLVIKVLPGFRVPYDGLSPPLLIAADAIRPSALLWSGILSTLILVAFIVVLRLVYGRSLSLQSGRWNDVLILLPGTRSLLAKARAASLTEILTLLVEHEVPLEEALTLAGEAVGDAATERAAKAVAADVRRGARPVAGLAGSGLSPLVEWLLLSGIADRKVVPLLRHTADVYRRQVARQADFLRFFLPALLTVAIGGTVTLLYVLTIFVPYAELLEYLSGVYPQSHGR